MKQKIITCAGYYGTGSSAITDLLGEFDNVYYMGDYEMRFVQDPGGVTDLDYNIVENYHRHNSGHALKRYKKNIDFLSGNKWLKRYESYFNGQFRKISYEYIDSLTAFKFKGYWHQDVIDKGKMFWFTERTLDNIYNKLLSFMFRKNDRSDLKSIHLLKNELTYVPHSGEDFYQKTRKYLNELFTIANSGKKEFVMVDQLVPPSNLNRYLRYFDDLKIISIDRDPRDLFILEKIYWNGGVVPCSSVIDFCKWFELTRKHIKYEIDDQDKILRLKFEDLIYHYDDSLQKIISFLDIDEQYHSRRYDRLDPKKSVINTQLWKKHVDLKEEIEYIESHLKSYCYNNY